MLTCFYDRPPPKLDHHHHPQHIPKYRSTILQHSHDEEGLVKVRQKPCSFLATHDEVSRLCGLKILHTNYAATDSLGFVKHVDFKLTYTPACPTPFIADQ